jgi:hypothetical protein
MGLDIIHPLLIERKKKDKGNKEIPILINLFYKKWMMLGYKENNRYQDLHKNQINVFIKV